MSGISSKSMDCVTTAALRDWYGTKKVVVCGGAGFIGSHIVDLLVDIGAQVVVIDPCEPDTGGRPENLAASLDRIEWVNSRIEEMTDIDGVLGGSDLVIDCMGYTRHHQSIENPMRDVQLNYLSHLALLSGLDRCPTDVVVVGSRAQYGRLSGTVDEAFPQMPLDPQGVHKSAAEAMFRISSSKGAWGCVCVRAGNCFGPRQMIRGKDIGLVGGFIASLLNGETVDLYGTAERSRHLIYVNDLTSQLIGLAMHIKPGFDAVNSVGEQTRIQDVLDLLVNLCGGSYTFKPFPEDVASVEPGQAIIMQERLMQYLGEIKYSGLEEALQETVEYFREELQA